MRHRAVWSPVICGLLLVTFCLGLPQVHYAVALMIAVIARHSDKALDEPLFYFGSALTTTTAKGKETKASG
jgi:hypothetical protein